MDNSNYSIGTCNGNSVELESEMGDDQVAFDEPSEVVFEIVETLWVQVDCTVVVILPSAAVAMAMM